MENFSSLLDIFSDNKDFSKGIVDYPKMFPYTLRISLIYVICGHKTSVRAIPIKKDNPYT